MIFGYIDQLFDNLSANAGLPDDQLKLVFSWVACIPLGQLNRLIDNPILRNLYSLILGLFFSYLCIKDYIYICLATSLACYLTVQIKGRNCALASYIIAFSVLIAGHTYRYHHDYLGWRFNGAISLMYFVCKMIYFTFYYADGRIKNCPSLFNYLGYVYFYPTAIIGPAIDYETYEQFIYKKNQYSTLPSTLLPALKQLFLAILFIILFVILQPFINKSIFEQQWYQDQNLLGRIIITQFVIMDLRIHFYAGFKFGQAGLNSTGISYNGVDEKTKSHKFDRIQTNKMQFELEFNPKLKTGMWNTTVHLWLKRCFFERIVNTQGPTLALLSTFIVSAMWHGVHPIYYFGFMHWALAIECTRLIEKAKDKFQWIPMQIRKIIVYFLVESVVGYVGVGMVLIDWNTAMVYYRQQYYFVTVGLISIYILLKITKFGQNSSATINKQTESTKKNN